MRAKRILLVETTMAEAGWRVLQGLSSQVEGQGWSVRITSRTERLESIIDNWRPDAAVVYPPQHVSLFVERGIPVVQTFSHGETNGAAQVLAEDERIGKLGAEHFLERGIRTVIYAGLQTGPTGADHHRFQALRGRIEAAGGKAVELLDDGRYFELAEDMYVEVRPALSQLLRETPKPFGIMAHDIIAYWLYSAVRDAGLTIPKEVCILGAADDEVYCRLCQPTLTSIHIPWRQYGQAAGKAIQMLFEGTEADSIRLRVSEPYLATRDSTALMQTSDALVQRAVDYIGKHITEPVNVTALCRELGVSSTNLKTRFRIALGRSPLEEIHRQKLERAMHELRETERSVVEIASSVGLSGPEHLIRLFKRKTGLTPSAYRQSMRLR